MLGWTMNRERLREIAARAFGAVMLVAGVAHFAVAGLFLGFFAGAPAWVPALPLVYASGVVELLVGVALLLPATRALGALATLGMMVAYLPLHALDALRAHPVVGSPAAAWIRLVLQFALIAWAWWISPLWRGRET